MGARVRTITADEMSPWLDQMGVSFFRRTPEGSAEFYLRNVDLERTRGGFDGDRVVGTLRSFATEFTVPGPTTIAASALTNVTVAPTHRRRGLLTEMIVPDLRDSAERGEAVSILIAAEFPIYGRFGYGPAVESAKYTISSAGLRFNRPSVGRVELVSDREFRALAPPIYERFRLAQPGSIERRDYLWDAMTHIAPFPGAEPPKGSRAIYYSPRGDAEGFVSYKGEMANDMRQNGTLTVDDLTAVSSDAYQALWEFCCGIDLTTTVVASERPVDETLSLLVDDARKVQMSARHDFVWVRVLNTPVALGGRRYSSAERIVIEVIDALGLAAGTFALDAGRDGASCTAVNESPDITVPVSSLGAAYLGATSFSRLHSAGAIYEHRAGAVERADRMFFVSRAPWCTTWF